MLTRIGLGAEDVRRVGLAHGQGVEPRDVVVRDAEFDVWEVEDVDYDDDVVSFEWATMIQLSRIFKVPPHVWLDYEPAEIAIMVAYLNGYAEGEEIKYEQRRKK